MVGKNVAPVVGRIAQVKISLAVGDVPPDAAVAVDAGADAELGGALLLHLDEHVAIIGIVADGRGGHAGEIRQSAQSVDRILHIAGVVH